MSEIRIPGQPPGNPLTALTTSMVTTNSHLAKLVSALNAIEVNTRKETKHIYAMAVRHDQTWGTYCLACSEEEEEYIYPCRKYAERLVPPSHIVEDPDFAMNGGREVDTINLPDEDGRP